MASTEYIRQYMREYRLGKRRGPRKMIQGSRAWLKAHRLFFGKAALAIQGRGTPRPEEPIGPQIIPVHMMACPRCDILTRRSDVCGYCASETLHEVQAA